MTTEELQRLYNKLALIHPAEVGLRAGQAVTILRELIEHRKAIEEQAIIQSGPEATYALPVDRFPPYA